MNVNVCVREMYRHDGRLMIFFVFSGLSVCKPAQPTLIWLTGSSICNVQEELYADGWK